MTLLWGIAGLLETIAGLLDPRSPRFVGGVFAAAAIVAIPFVLSLFIGGW